VQLADVVETSLAVAATSSRRAKIELVANAVRALTPEETPAGVAFLGGEPRQRQVGVGYAALRELPAPAGRTTLTVAEVDEALARIGGAQGRGSRGERRRLLTELFARATEPEQRFLRALLAGGVRQGALDGIVLEAVARANDVPAADARRALMLLGQLGAVAEIARSGGVAGLREVRLAPGRPVQPMLAQTAPDLETALERLGAAALEWKLDGVRIQVHRVGHEVAVFTRTLDDVTERTPELVEAARALPAETVVLDGEAIALQPGGRPHPFQVTSSRFASRVALEELRASLPLSAFFFDVLHLDGADLLDEPASQRLAALEQAVPGELRVPRIVSADAGEAVAFLADALAHGHEGVMVKALDAPYEAGRRGGGWLKVKPAHTLDLVVLAAEWGHGRRRGFLSNLHLGARDPASGSFVMLGKTFKGLTDAMLAWQTERLLELEATRDAWTVHVRPELVVEIAFDGVQASSRYPGGVALRFARVKGYRTDKRAGEADTIDAVRAIHAGEPPGPSPRT
jgi:DNA ligase-1